MTASSKKKRAGRTGHSPTAYGLIDWLNALSDVCGYCAGQRAVWCPDCGGGAGCRTCGRTRKVPCPVCSGGLHEKWAP